MTDVRVPLREMHLFAGAGGGQVPAVVKLAWETLK